MKRAASLALLLLLGIGVVDASAQSKTGTTIAQFTGIEPSARHAAIGNAGAALSVGLESVYFNPGALGAIDRPSVLFTHSAWFADISYEYAAGALPISGFGTLFASVTSLNSGEIDVRTVDSPLGTGERYAVSDVALSLGYGRQITRRFAAGVQINYITEEIWNSSVNILTLSVGTVYRLSENGAKMGFSLTNLGTRGRFEGRDLAIQYDGDPNMSGDNNSLPGSQFTEEFPVPVLFRVGVSVPRQLGEDNRLLMSFDALHPNDSTESVNAGMEWSWRETLSLRAGYQTLFQEDSVLGLTLGFGLQAKWSQRHIQLDYAWADHEYLEPTHRTTVMLSF